MKKLLFVLIVGFVLYSCSDSSTGSGPEDGQLVGTFMVYSDHADWVGTQASVKSKAKIKDISADTIVLENPDGNSLQLIANTTSIGYVDSSFTEAYFDTTNASRIVEMNTPFDVSYFLATSLEGIFNVGTNVENFKCDSTYSYDNEYLEFVMLEEDSTFHKAIHINANGIVDAFKEMKCN